MNPNPLNYISHLTHMHLFALQGERHYVLWNPPEREELFPKRTPVGDTATQGGVAVKPKKKKVRRCVKKEAAIIMAELVKKGLSTICFNRVRRSRSGYFIGFLSGARRG